MITKFKMFENNQRFIEGKYWIVKSDDLYIGTILKEYDIYDDYEDVFINNKYMKKYEKIILAIGIDTDYNTLIACWDDASTDRIKYWESQFFVYHGELLNDDDIKRFKKEVEFEKTINKYNL